MPTDVIMPQMGESIFEGTITKWLKKVGDAVEKDEPLFEISTDKVDAEIPSPVAGVLSEIKIPEGATVGSQHGGCGAVGTSGAGERASGAETLHEQRFSRVRRRLRLPQPAHQAHRRSARRYRDRDAADGRVDL